MIASSSRKCWRCSVELSGFEATRRRRFDGRLARPRRPELDQVRHAATRAIRTCKFFPTVAELRHFAGCVTSEQRTALAWPAVVRAVKCRVFVASGLFVFDCPWLNETVHNIGPGRFADFFEPEFLRRDFERVFRLIAESGVLPREPRPIAGRGYHMLLPADRVGRVHVLRTGLPWAQDANELVELTELAPKRDGVGMVPAARVTEGW